MTFSREWMYQIGTSEFYDGIEEFMKQAYSFARSKGFVDGTIQCPCNSCKNLSWKGIEDAKYDLYWYGFVPNYYVWDKHGEQHSQRINRELPNRAKAVNLARNMVIDAAGSQFKDLIFEAPTPPEPPNPAAKRFFDLLSNVYVPLYKGCEGHSTLSATSRMLNIKSDFNMSQTCYDRVMHAIKEFIPRSTMCSNYYESKKIVSQLGLGAEECEARPLYRWIHAFWDVLYLIFLLPKDHPFRRNKDSFTKERVENDTPQSRLSGLETWGRVQKYPKVTDEHYPIDGVDTYDAFRERNFNLKAALMWRINDFPAYDMLSGWSTHGRLSCPYCMEKKNDTPPPRLSGLETWRRVRKYPKVTDERYPIEKNLIDNIVNTVMDDKDKTKDNLVLLLLNKQVLLYIYQMCLLLIKEQYMEKYGDVDSHDKKSRNIANTYIRWAYHVGSKKGKFYGLSSGFDRYIFDQVVDSIGQTSQNHEMVQLREILDCQKIQYDLLKVEQERMKATHEVHT
nr:hypothetical protein [Tanacetum cinerariifolium]